MMYLPFSKLLLSEDEIKKLSWLYLDIAMEEAREAEDKYRSKVEAINEQYKKDLLEWAREKRDKTE